MSGWLSKVVLSKFVVSAGGVTIAAGVLLLLAPVTAGVELPIPRRAEPANSLQSMPELQEPPVALTVTAEAVGCHWRYAYAGAGAHVSFDPGRASCATKGCTVGFDVERAAAVPGTRPGHRHTHRTWTTPRRTTSSSTG